MSNALFTPPIAVNEPVLKYGPGSPEKQAIKSYLNTWQNHQEDIPLVIGGEKLLDRPTADITSPQRHKRILAHYRKANLNDVTRAIEAAVAAGKDWSRMDWQDRAAVFLKAADLLATKYRPTVNGTTMLGQGKTVFQAEIDAACELIDFFRFNVSFAHQIYGQQPQSSRGIWNRSEARGLEGFVFAIGPFNFTAISMNLAASPAIMGTPVVWKPATTALLSSYKVYEILEEAGLPPGVINLVTGDHEIIGKTCLESEHLAGIHFTGSTGTFNYLWQTVGKNIDKYRAYPRLVGETGGKDFVFAHPSADPEQLVTALVRGAFEYQGQKCSAASRAYIPESIWNEVKKALVDRTNSLTMGDPEDFTNFMGAVIDRRAFDKIKTYIEHANAAKDAQVIAGGECDDSTGYFIRPTVIETSNPHYKSMVEEIFGPVLTVFVYKDQDLEQTLKLCDESTTYALTGSIFARSRKDIAALSAALSNAAGNFYVNDKPTGAVVGQQPFGGGRKSGTNDKAGSVYNLLRWVSHRTMKENFLPIVDHTYPHMSEV